MSQELELLKKIKDIMSDLIYINSIIATELIKITENTAATRHGEEFLNKSTCIAEHNQLNEDIIRITKNYVNSSKSMNILEKHVLKHLED